MPSETIALLYGDETITLKSVKGRDFYHYGYIGSVGSHQIEMSKSYDDTAGSWHYTVYLTIRGIAHTGQSSNIQKALDIAAGLHLGTSKMQEEYNDLHDDSDDADTCPECC